MVTFHQQTHSVMQHNYHNYAIQMEGIYYFNNPLSNQTE